MAGMNKMNDYSNRKPGFILEPIIFKYMFTIFQVRKRIDVL